MLVKSRKSREQLAKEARAKRRLRIKLARTSPNHFCEFVLKDEETGKSVKQAPVHETWHRLCDEQDRLLIWAHIESGKTQQMAIARTLWDLGNDPALRFLIISNTHNQAIKLGRLLRQYVDQSQELHEVFPNLKKGTPWGDTAFAVERSTFAKDPSVQLTGIHGSVLGSRVDRILLDDVLDYENCRSEIGRQEVIDWYNSTPNGRLIEGGKVRCIGTAFHPQDLLHHFAKTPGWAAFRYPVIDPSTQQPRWPERWSLARIHAKRMELGSTEFTRQMLCEARDDLSAKFKRAWINRCLHNGNGRQLNAMGLKVVPRGYSIYTGVDLAVQQKDSSDLTVLFTIAVDPMGMRHVLSCESGKWAGPEIVNRIIDIHHRFQSIVIVENNAAQDFILQFTRHRSAVPLKAFTTGRQKAHPEFGIEGIATEMENGKWSIPNKDGVCHPEIQKWIDEMLYYDPKAHTGDRLMACWFAREGVVKSHQQVETYDNVDFLFR
jgi:hypothetical protein